MAQEVQKHWEYFIEDRVASPHKIPLATKGINCKQQQGTVQEVIPPDVFNARRGEAILQCTHGSPKGKCFPASTGIFLSFTQRRQSLLSQEGEQCKLMFNARFTHISIRQ